MSRIHEALLQVQERAQTDPKPAPAVDEVRPVQDSEGRASILTPETLQVSVKRTREWQPGEAFRLSDDPAQVQIVGEQFRSLRSRLYRLGEVRPLHKILVTSAVPGEGKTFVAMNLAQALSQVPSHRVVLLDADLRCSRIDKCLGKSVPGLSDYLQGKADEISILRQGPQNNLYLVPAGTHMEGAAELIAEPRFELLLQRLRQVFDWVVIDSPPVVPVSDAIVMAAHCEGVILVVKSDSTPHGLAQQACRELQNRPLLGVILNHAPFSKRRYGKYYSRYGYGYGYGQDREIEKGKDNSRTTKK